MANRGVVYVTYGARARAETEESIKSLRETNGLPVAAIGDKPIDGADHISFEQRDAGGRWAKVNLDLLSPFEQTLYLDADTRPKANLSAGFQILDAGFDLVICPSTRQKLNVMGHAPQEDREATFEALGCRAVLGLQGGMFYFARNERMAVLFATWREEWERFGYMDQPALMRALDRVPVRVWLLSWDWNSAGGSIVDHRFGAARA